METSQPLSIESFSYSWLVNLKPSLENLDNSLRASLDASEYDSSFIEMDPRMPPSQRFFIRNSQDFKFDFPISKSPLTLLHADELFSNGYVMPLVFDPLKMGDRAVSGSRTSAIPTSSCQPSKGVVSASETRGASSLRKCRRLSKRIFQKYLDFLKPLVRRIRGHRSSSMAETIDTKCLRSFSTKIYSTETSPRISVAYSIDDWRRSCDSDSSIYEAVLHCKRSIGK